ncbi:MAG TPA: polysaccharide deacetylase family protein, partial [Sphingobacteriaceae bacterium]|nr:polysaccharide deacetylase family protein [Sphingobacteriaceae bacterium]
MQAKIKFKSYLKSVIPKSIMIQKLPGESSKRAIITFDDGPCPQFTPKVLEVLRQHRCKAIFFVVGKKCEENPELVKDIIREGHLLANHSYNHINTDDSNFNEYKDDVKKCDIVLSKFGANSGLFRPPFGRLNLKSIYAAKSLDLKMILMSNSGGEWNYNKNESPNEIANSIISKLKNNDIILMHDNNKNIPIALEILIDYLQENQIRYDFE